MTRFRKWELKGWPHRATEQIEGTTMGSIIFLVPTRVLLTPSRVSKQEGKAELPLLETNRMGEKNATAQS